MNINRYLSDYLKNEDFPKPVLVEVVEIKEHQFDDELKLVLYFRGETRGIVLGKVQLRQLVDVFDSIETDEWIGQQVEVYRDPNVMFGGRRVGGIRFNVPGAPVERSNTKTLTVPSLESKEENGSDKEGEGKLPPPENATVA